jgi:hypothetical protein
LIYLDSVCYNDPILFRNDDLERKRSSDAWLIEAWEESVAKEWLTVRVDVNFLVFFVLETMKTCTIVHISVVEIKPNLIVLLQELAWYQDPMLVKIHVYRRLSINRELA